MTNNLDRRTRLAFRSPTTVPHSEGLISMSESDMEVNFTISVTETPKWYTHTLEMVYYE